MAIAELRISISGHRGAQDLHQWPSEASRSHQKRSAALSDTQRPSAYLERRAQNLRRRRRLAVDEQNERLILIRAVLKGRVAAIGEAIRIHSLSEFISVHQCSSVFISVHQCSSVFISVHQCSSVVISGHQWSSVFISGHQRSSVVLSGHPRTWSSEVISGH